MKDIKNNNIHSFALLLLLMLLFKWNRGQRQRWRRRLHTTGRMERGKKGRNWFMTYIPQSKCVRSRATMPTWWTMRQNNNVQYTFCLSSDKIYVYGANICILWTHFENFTHIRFGRTSCSAKRKRKRKQNKTNDNKNN